MKQIIPFILLLSTVLVQPACKKEDLTVPKDRNAVPRSTAEFIRNNYDLSLLAAGLQQVGILDSLGKEDNYTVLAPDNDAFREWGISNAKDFARLNKDSLRAMMKYHIIKGRLYINDIPTQMGNKYPTLAGPDVHISVVGDNNKPVTPAAEKNIRVNGAYMYLSERRDIATANGVVHILRKPLKMYMGSLQDMITADTSLSLFKIAMQRFNHWDALKTKDPLTVLAPVNAAFREYGLTADSLQKINPNAFQPFMMGVYTLMEEKKRIFSSDWQMINAATNGTYNADIQLLGFRIRPYYEYNPYWNTEVSSVALIGPGDQSGVYGPPSVKFVGGPNKGADFVASNGVLHKIDALMLYPNAFRK